MTIQAVYVTNGSFDAVLVPNRTALLVDKEVMQHFLDAQTNEDDFSDWNGIMNWPTGMDDIWEAAKRMGDIIAYYEDGYLNVIYEQLWEKRKEFWGI